VEVDPVQGDRLRVALEERPRQRHLEVPALEGKLLGQFAVAADDTDVRPAGAFLVQGASSLPSFQIRTFALPSSIDTAASTVTLPFEARKLDSPFRCSDRPFKS
jgi:hypothetical protein